MFPPLERWHPKLNWAVPAGRLLDRVVEALPAEPTWEIIVFGSAPLQLGLDPGFTSADVDLIADLAIEPFLGLAGLLKEQSPFYADLCQPHAFAAPHDWRARAHAETRRHVCFLFPHPIDILASKVCRLDEKDLAAFRLVRERTGHPTAEEMIQALRGAVDIYRPGFEGEERWDAIANTELLWRKIFGAEIDVRREIIRPALAERSRFFDTSAGDALKERLRQIGEMDKPR